MFYVDKLYKIKRTRKWPYDEVCHLVTDGTVLELIEFGEKIGLNRAWLQTKNVPHFDLNSCMRHIALITGKVQENQAAIGYCADIWRKKKREMGEIPALSIKQPWAWLIPNSHKNVENRTWYTDYRGELLIHASRSFDMDGYKWVQQVFPQIKMPLPEGFQKGGIIGKAYLGDCVSEKNYSRNQDLWFFGPYGFLLSNKDPLPFIPFAGKLGFFPVPRALYEGILLLEAA